ncbi:MAG: hypothetical protein V2A74_00910 [bacterium]
MSPAPRKFETDPVTENYKKDLDPNLIRKSLQLSPQERLERVMNLQEIRASLLAMKRVQQEKESINFWLDLFTGTTWEEFRTAGARVSGFRNRMRKTASSVRPGDILLCYLTGVMRWVGALEVMGPSKDRTRIWKQDEFPIRFDVNPLIMLDPEAGVPMEQIEGKVDFYSGPEHKGKFKAFLRQSPNPFRRIEDGLLIFDLLNNAQSFPVLRPVDPKKLARKPFYKAEFARGKTKLDVAVSVPDAEEVRDTAVTSRRLDEEGVVSTQHTEMQYLLLNLGAEMGLDVWVAKNDRSKSWNGKHLGNLPGIVDELPTQFNEATTRTIELIDVLWLKGNSIMAAFEVESTTSIYSGLLRMSDLLALQPNLDIKLYLVAPDERRNKVEQEILRPTFRLRDKPLSKTCGFLGFSTLLEKVKAIESHGLASSLKPEFLDKVAEFFGDLDARE